MSEVPPAMRWTERVSASNKVVRKEAVVLMAGYERGDAIPPYITLT
jgi:hypothetical protein